MSGRVLIIALIVVGGTSCIDLGFDQPQPPGQPDLTAFPLDLIGTYANETDTLVIRENVIVKGKDSTNIVFSDSIRLRTLDGWYYLNLTDGDRSYWSVVCAKRKGNNLQLLLPEIEEEDKSLIEESWPVKEYYNSLGNLQAYVISPDKEEWKKLRKSEFYSKVKLRKIK